MSRAATGSASSQLTAHPSSIYDPEPFVGSRPLITALRALLVIMGHLQPGPLKSTLNVESLIRLAAIQNTLVTTHLLGHRIQCLNNPQPQLLTLLVLCHGDVLNVAHEAHVVDKFPLDDHCAGAHDSGGFVAD